MAIEKEYILKVSTDGGKKNVDSLNKSLGKTEANQKKIASSTKKVSKATKSSTNSTQRNAAAFEAVNKATGGAIRGFRALIKQMWLLVANPVGLVIAAVVLGLSALYKAFASTKAGGEKLDQIMAGISATIDVVRDRILKVGSALIKFFSGDFKGAFKAGKEAVSGFGAEVAKEFEQAANSVKALQEVEDAMRNLSVSRAKLNRDLIQAKEIIEGGTASYAEKKKAIDEVRIAETKQTDEELKNAKKKLDAIVLANSLSDSGSEDLGKEAEARKAVFNLEAISSSNKTKFNKLAKLADNEELSRIKAIADAKKKAADDKIANDKKVAADKKIIDDKEIADAKAVQKFKDSLIELDKENKFAAIEKEKEDRIKAIEELKLSTEQKNQMLLDVDAAFKEKKKAIEDNEQLIKDEKLAAFIAKEIEDKELTLEQKKEESLAELDRLNGTQEQRAAIIKKYADIEAADEDELRKTKILAVGSAFGKIAGILGENSKAGKAAAAASALINTYQGITAELATKTATPFGFAMKLVNIASTAAIGFKSVKSILATNAKAGGGAATNPAAGASSAPPQPPAFNIVGSSETNQLADAIGSQKSQPVKAFVVAGDVSTAQEMDRNVISDASIG
tara:strand:+ start:13393 stop:15261 length:1869 start_codon:yes stop_codon:yes gene_type:complete